jgi:hypothetical protein
MHFGMKSYLKSNRNIYPFKYPFKQENQHAVWAAEGMMN